MHVPRLATAAAVAAVAVAGVTAAFAGAAQADTISVNTGVVNTGIDLGQDSVFAHLSAPVAGDATVDFSLGGGRR
jgi:hypothetical protein